LIYGGYTDWYLPSKSEMAYIYCKSNANAHNTSFPHEDPDCLFLGGKSTQLTGFDTTNQSYWTSSENAAGNAWWQNMSTGGQFGDLKSQNYRVRCVRRYDTPAPTRVQLVAASNAESTTNLATASFTPRNNSLLVAVVGGAAEDGVPTVTVTGGGLTWTRRVNVNNNSSNFPSWHTFSEIWTAPVTTGVAMTGTLSVNRFTDGKFMVVYQYTGHDSASPFGATATGFRDDATGRWSMNLSATPAVTSDVIATVAINNWDGTGSDNVSYGTGWTELYKNGAIGAETQGHIQGRAAPNTNVVGWGLVDALEAAGANSTGAALEIKIAP
jgi:hypothetical protein